VLSFSLHRNQDAMAKLPEGEIPWPKKVATAADAVRFIDAVGYCLKVSIKNLLLPSLYYAVARRDIRDGPGWDRFYEKIWHWKDALPRRHRAFYARYFKGRGTFISLNLLPHFLALEGAAVASGDYCKLYAEGRISADARLICEMLERHGPLATLELRHASKMETVTGNARFKRAMAQLERRLLVVHFSTEQETTAWASGRFELTCRAFPAETAQAREISLESARARIAAKYREWHSDALAEPLARLFGWTKAEAIAAIESPPSRQ
jgi:hypothetical protein